jgi:energy-coupling factor transporter ATP-binding protein EcfA2
MPATLVEALAPLQQQLRPTNGFHSQPEAAREQAATAGTLLIEFRNVSHEYRTGHKGIDNLTLSIASGEFVAICGMNGAGKTTTALHVMGLLKPTSGAVLVDGHDTRLRTVAEMARTVGLIFQNPNHQLFKDTVAGEVGFGPRNLGWDEQRIEEATVRVLELVGLGGMEERDPESLSIGQKQRVAIASVLVMEPRILILDEPTTGQDQQTLEPFMRLVSQLNREGMTVLMITHDMEVAMRYSSRIIVMNQGKVLADAHPSDIFLQEDVLREASLHLPEILALTKQLDGTRPIYLGTLDEVEGWLGLPRLAQEEQA